MKAKRLKTLVLCLSFCTFSCVKLDLNPLSEASSGNWYSTEDQLEMSINGLFRIVFWPLDDEEWSDDQQFRNTLSAITNGSINGETSFVSTYWANSYKAIARCNNILEALENNEEISESKKSLFRAQALFVRAAQHAMLSFHFGDVIYINKVISISDAFELKRTDRKEVMQNVYSDIDEAIKVLPVKYTTGPTTITKGGALAFKARYALYNGDWEVAKEAARTCIGLEEYGLEANYPTLFYNRTKFSNEFVFVLPRSIEYNQALTKNVQNRLPRTKGGYASVYPSWELFCSYLCIDGKPIDESPLFDSKNPFLNRDPRCNYTIVEFGTNHLGVEYNPDPKIEKVFDTDKNSLVKNLDNKTGSAFSSYNGLLLKKGIDYSWMENSYKIDPNHIIIRYADVLLMYAEAKIELDEIDDSVLSAINDVRARAYSEMSTYPEVTTTNQAELRKTLRIERRMEFAHEGLRYKDIIRWKIAEKALNKPSYGLVDRADLIKLINDGNWFFSEVPEIDINGIADFESLYNKKHIKLIVDRFFDANKQYLWPIPSKEILINPNIIPNDNY